jgi:somatic embryogenesis receptor kinase 1
VLMGFLGEWVVVFFVHLTVKALSDVRQALHDPHNALVSWDVNYISPCTFMWVQCSTQQVVTSM